MKKRFATPSTRSANAVRRLALAGLAFSAAPLFAATFTSTWTGGSAVWSSVANWNTPGAPGTFPNNGGSTYDAVLGVNSIVTLVGNIEIQKFNMSTGTVTGNFELKTNELFTWTGGVLSGTGLVNANGGMTLSGNGIRDLSGGRTLNNPGTTTWTNTSGGNLGRIRLTGGSTINNSGLWQDQTTVSTDIQNGGGTASAFNNLAGATYTKSGGTATTGIAIPFNNAGTVNVNSGTLTFTGGDGGTTTGDFNVASGATLNFQSNFALAGNADLTGAGTVQFITGAIDVGGTSYNITGASVFSGATVTFSTPITSLGSGPVAISGGVVNINSTTPAFPSLNFSGGTLGGSTSVDVTGAITWTGGTMTGSLTTNANGGMTLSGNGIRDLSGGRTLNNPGTTTWTNTSGGNLGRIRLTGGSTINNSGLWQDQTTVSTDIQNGGGTASAFNNLAGATYTKSGGTATTGIAIPFNNAGTVNVNSGTLTFTGGDGGTTTGDFNVASGATLNFQSNFALAGNADLTGAGTVQFITGAIDVGGTSYNITGASVFSGATVTFSTPITSLGSGPVAISGGVVNINSTTPAFPSLNFSGGTLGGSTSVDVTGAITWTGGTMTGSLTTNANGGMTLSGNGIRDLSGGRTLNNPGTTTWTNTSGGNLGRIRLTGGSTINNSGLWQDQTTVSTDIQNGGGTASAFNNLAGATYTKSGGTATTGIAIPFNNTGSVNVSTGALTFTGGMTQHSGTNLTGGTWNVSGGASINITTGSNITTNQGSVMLDGVGSSFAKFTTALSSNQGIQANLTLKNDRDLTAAGALANSGNVTVDGAGTTLTIPGANAYSQTDGATLLSNGGQISAPAVTLTGGTFTVNGGTTGSVLAVTSGGAGLTFGGTGSPTITLDSSNSVPGKILLTNNVTVDNTLTSGTAQILSGGSGMNPGAIDLGGARTFSVNDGSAAVDLRVSASVQNGALTKTGLGTLALTGANTFTAGTTVSGGVLEAGGSGALGGTSGVIINTGGTLLLSGAGDRVNDAAGITLVGGKLDTGGLSETLGTLTLSASSVIDMGAGASVLRFADSSAPAIAALWTGTLSIWNWSGNQNTGNGTDQLYFGNGSGIGLVAGQLLQIKFYSDAGSTLLPFAPGFSGFTGGFGEVVPVPEPGSVATAMGLLGLIGWRERRRRG